MTRCSSRRLPALWVVLLLVGQACGDDDDNPDPSSDGKTSADAGPDGGSREPMRRPTGGASSMEGAAANGGSASSPDEAYGCKPKQVDPGGRAALGFACCGGLGACTTAERGGEGYAHAECSASSELYCVPRPAAEQASNEDAADGGAAESAGSAACRVQLPGTPEGAPDYEGRCIAACFVQQLPIVSRLRQATCAATEVCAPCYDPLTGDSTGLCERDGDAPNDPPTPGFPECGEGLGYCVPTYAAGTQASQLSQLTCAAGELCAPKIKAADPNACFDRCTSGLGAGACVPSFLAGGVAAALAQESCQEHELCAPCELLGTRFGVCD
ncbi:MAG: hypothetical protein ABW321_02020 [Polyangiales bacterium]